jgi:predicted nucleotide-binding protein
MPRNPERPPRHILTIEQTRNRIEQLQDCIRRLEVFDPQSVQKREVMALQAAIDSALAAAFGPGSPSYNRYKHAATLEGKQQSIGVLGSAIQELRQNITDLEFVALQFGGVTDMPNKGALSRKVFVVHGRDDAKKNEVALFLSSIGLEPIILHTRPNGGRNILTKFQEESEGAGFAVILMTPDDEGALVGETLQKRARQNVVFELGFFIGKLGTPNVAALVKGPIEKLSDFDGIGYIDFDAKEEWKRLLAREMHNAQVPFDASKVFTT